MKRKPDGKMHRAGRVLVQAGRVLTGKQMAGRNLTVFPDDVFLTSYPRSGNTWTRFLIGNLIYQDEPVTFANIESRLPEIYFNSDHYLRSLPRPRILKSHECFQPQYPRVIYIVRDPRDVAVSFYHHNVKAGNIADDYPMEAFIPRFIAAEFDAKWGSWSDNVLSWLALRESDPGFILLRYETMKANPIQELQRVCAFLERCAFRKIDSSPEKLQRAVTSALPNACAISRRLRARIGYLRRTHAPTSLSSEARRRGAGSQYSRPSRWPASNQPGGRSWNASATNWRALSQRRSHNPDCLSS